MVPSPNPRLQRTPAASPPSPLSRKPFGDYLGRLLLLLSAIVIPACASQTNGPPRISVALAPGYDIGTDLKLMEAVGRAFRQSPDFDVVVGSTPWALFVNQLANTELERIGGRERARYSIGFYDTSNQQVGAARGECWMDNLSECAVEIVKEAQMVGPRALSLPRRQP
jgi:hypothetical protein